MSVGAYSVLATVITCSTRLSLPTQHDFQDNLNALQVPAFTTCCPSKWITIPLKTLLPWGMIRISNTQMRRSFLNMITTDPWE